MSNFDFLPHDLKQIAQSAARAEGCIMADPRAACFHARFALEALVHWLYRHDGDLRMPYDHTLGALLHEPTFQNILPQKVFQPRRLDAGWPPRYGISCDEHARPANRRLC